MRFDDFRIPSMFCSPARLDPASDAVSSCCMLAILRMVAVSFACGVLMFNSRAAEAEGPRAARSVHWGWPAPDAEIFCTSMMVDRSAPGSYFMACGWNTGYFGIQELTNGKKVIIFSVWDPSKGDNPNEVKAEERVECLFNEPEMRI